MKVEIEINDNYLKYLQNVNINSYINELIAEDIYLNSKEFEKHKLKMQQRLQQIEKGEIISHEELWKEIDEL